MSTNPSKPSSHRSRLTTPRARTDKANRSATGGTNPHVISVALCGIKRVEKSAQDTVHEGRKKPGNAAGGTSHWKCAEGFCAWRAEPLT